MEDIFKSEEQSRYWTERYQDNRTGWDIGFPSTPIKAYIDQLDRKDLKILIPGAGNAYEAEYLWKNGFEHTHVMDISEMPLKAFAQRVPNFPADQLLQQNFFDHDEQYDLIFEQTFFCSFIPSRENRTAYARQMANLIKPGGKLVGLWFKHPIDPTWTKRPFGGSKEEYQTYFEPYFKLRLMEDAYNSIPPRMGNELFAIMVRKAT
ncbi:MAG: methyltransferase domain-containing protein [Bacteroidota bacterium]